MDTQLLPTRTSAPPKSAPTAGQALEETIASLSAKGIHDPQRWAETLLASVLDTPHIALGSLAHCLLSPAQAEHLHRLLPQVTPDAPVAYLVGRAPFLDNDFEVNSDTLICKSDTELFVQIILNELNRQPLPPNPHILELCTGSGCVAITLAKRLPHARVVATDLSAPALSVARRNIARHGLQECLTLGEGDLFAPVAALAQGRPFDLIVSNPPYIPTEKIAAMGRPVADHEPRLALDGGEDGLDPHRRILAEAAGYLALGGRLFLEHEHYQGPDACTLARTLPAYEDVRTIQDANRRARALHARCP